MERGGGLSKFLFFGLSVILLVWTYTLVVDEGNVDGPQERDSNGQYDVTIITEGSSFNLLLDMDGLENEEGQLEIEPALPTGIKLFENNWSLGDRTMDMFDNKLCQLSMNGGFVCLDSSDINSSLDWHFPPAKNSIYSSISVGGNHYCAILSLKTGSEINCWGSNTYGQLGNHSDYFPEKEVKVSRPEGVIWNDLVTGESHTCALTDGGSVYCWGMGSLGQIGDGTFYNTVIPSKVNFTTTSKITSLEAGQNHNCVLFSTNVVECWGWNGRGQIGDGTFEDSASPSTVSLDGDVIIEDLFLGPLSSCILSDEAEVYCWGDNYYNQISDDLRDSIPFPGKLNYSGGIQELLIGFDRICILSSDGKLICDLNNSVSLFGIDTNVRQVVHGKHMCFIFNNGDLSCHEWEDGSRAEEIDWILGISEIPTKFERGQISGVPLENYYGRHRVISNGIVNLDLEIVITVDFSKDIDRDGWSNIQELECYSIHTDRYSIPLDSDGDQICDYLDEDDDNDGFLDKNDSFPLDPKEWEDDDYDGIGKNTDSYEKWEPTLGVVITLVLLSMIFIAEIRRRD